MAAGPWDDHAAVPEPAAGPWANYSGSAPPAQDIAAPGFVPTVKRTGGQMLTTLATSIDDLTGPNKVTKSIRDTGQGIIDRNPAGINSIGDIVDSPWLAAKEAVGQFVPQIGAAAAGGIAGAAAGKRIGGAPGAAVGGIAGSLAPIFTQEYGGIRQDQQEAGKEDIPRALGTAAIATGLERVGMGKFLHGFGGVAAKSIPGEIAKGVLKEGGTEALQTSVEQVGAFKDPTTRENLADTAFAGAMGGIGGGIVSGGHAGVNKALAPKAEAPQPIAPVVEPAAVQPPPVSPTEPAAAVVPPVVAPLAGDPLRTAKLPETGPLAKTVNIGVEQEAASADAGAPVAAPITAALAGVPAEDAPHPKTPTATAEAPAQNVSVDGGEQGQTPSAAQTQAPQAAPVGPTFDPETGEILQPQRGTFPTRDGVEQYLSQQRLNGGSRMGKAIPVELPDKTFSFVREGEPGFIEAGRANAEALAAEKAKAKGEEAPKPLIGLQKRRALAAKEKAQNAQPVFVPADAGVADGAADGRGDQPSGSKPPVGRVATDATGADQPAAGVPSPSSRADAPVEPAGADAPAVAKSSLRERREKAIAERKAKVVPHGTTDLESAPATAPAGTIPSESTDLSQSTSKGTKTAGTVATNTTTAAGDSSTVANIGTGETPGTGKAEAPEAKSPTVLQLQREWSAAAQAGDAEKARALNDQIRAAKAAAKAEPAADAPVAEVAPVASETPAPKPTTLAQRREAAKAEAPVSKPASESVAAAPVASAPAPKTLKERREAAKPKTDTLMGQTEVDRRATIDAETMETRKGLPEIAQPMPGKNVVVVSRTLNGVKRVRAQIWEMPGYNGPQLAVAEYKSPRSQGYRVYMVKSGALAADNNGVKEMDREQTLQLAVRRIQNARDAINAREQNAKADARLKEANERGKALTDAAREKLFAKKPAADAPVAAAEPTHTDPGEKPEPATAPVVAESLKKAATAEQRKPSEMKADLLAQIDGAIAKAAAAPSDIGTTQPRTTRGKVEFSGVRGDGESRMVIEVRQGSDDKWHAQDSGWSGYAAARKLPIAGRPPLEIFRADGPAAARKYVESMLARASRGTDGLIVLGAADMVTFDVPGDGVFKVVNTRERLAEFRAKVDKAAGFKDSQPGGPPKQQAPASAGTTAALENMVEEGDFQAATDYAAAKGASLDALKLSKQDRSKLEAWQKVNPQGATEAAAEPVVAPAQAPEPVAATPSEKPAGGDQDRQGLRAEDRALQKLDSNASELASQMVGDLRGDDFDPAEARPALDAWAKDVGLASDDLRAAVVKLIRADSTLKAAERDTILKALDPTKAPAGKASEPAKTIADAGEKIGGSRKDRWKARGLDVSDLDAMSESEGAELATKANVWKPDWQAMVDAGMPAPVAAHAKIVYDRLAAAPKDNTPEGRRRYVKMMQAVREVYGNLTTENVATARDRLVYEKIGVVRSGGISLNVSPEAAEARKVLFSVYKGRSEPFGLDWSDLRKVKDMVADGFPAKGEPWTRRFKIRSQQGAGITEAGVRMYLTDSAAAGTPLTAEQIKAGFHEVRAKVGNKTLAYGVTQADAEAAAKNVYAALLTKEEGVDPERPHLDSMKREGLPKTIDRDVTQEDFLKQFGWRGVEFGNWSAQDERQKLLNLAFDGLNDLATIVGVPAKALSLNGTMGMAFGARGGGRFAAHYEPGKLVINMTKIRGGGSLAHEWAHAFDHYLGELDTDNAYKSKARGASGWYTRADYQIGKTVRDGVDEKGRTKWKTTERMDNLRPELGKAIDNVMMALYGSPRNPSQYAREAQKLSGKSSDGYWIRPTEMWARAFESYAFDKLLGMGARSDYLVHGVEGDRFAAADRYKGNPYPTGDERAKINSAFDALMAVVKTRDGDNGNVAMFSRFDPSRRQVLMGAAAALASTNVSADTTLGKAKPIDAAIMAKNVDPAVAKVLRGNGATNIEGAKALKQALGMIADSGPVEVRALARQVASLLPDSRLLLTVNDTRRVNAHGVVELSPVPHLTLFTAEGRTGLSYDTLLHESLHAAVAARYRALSTAVVRSNDDIIKMPAPAAAAQLEQFRALWREFRDMVKTDRITDPALKLSIEETGSPDEFFVRALTDAKLQQYMAGKAYEGKTLFEWFKDWVKSSLFGFKTSGTAPSWLDAALAASNDLTTAMVKDAADFKRLAAVNSLSARRESARSAMFSRTTPEIEAAQRIERTQNLVQSITSKWVNAPDVTVLVDMQDPRVPESVRNQDATQRSQGAEGEPAAFVNGGKVYLVASQLSTDKQVLEALHHEALGHFGLRGAFGNSLAPILDSMGRLNSAQVKAKALQYGLDFDKPNERRQAAEEVLAEMAGTNPQIGWVKKAVAAIRTWMRANVPGFSSMKYSDAELVRNFLAPAAGFVERGGKFADTQPMVGRPDAFSRTLGAALTDSINTARDVSLPAGYKVADLFNSSGKLSWWHKSVGTMHNLAQRHPEFKRVYDATQNFINDTSYYATEAANLAPKILPKLETWKDIAKTPLSAADTKAIAAPIFEGTLTWARDERGNPVKLADLEAKAASIPTQDKAREMLRRNLISENVLKMWQGMPIEQYEASVETRYGNQVLKAGVVWTDAELKSLFNLTPEQIGLYREFRTATDKSLTNLAISDMVRFGGKDAASVRQRAIDTGDVNKAAEILRDHLYAAAELDADRKDVLNDTGSAMIDKAERAADLMKRGYAPLSRFGQYTLDVVEPDGSRAYFGMFETSAERAKMARQMQANFPGATVTQGTVSEEAYKLFAGVSPETLELFGDMLGMESQGGDAASQAFQTYLKVAKTNRSAMKRLIERKGIAGFSEDAGRVLAGFVYSNARQNASNLNMGEMTEAASAISQQSGQLKDAALKLTEYVKNPQEEAQAIRGLLFTQYLGGSIASAMVNALQPLQVTFPYLSQYGGVIKAAKQMVAATRDALKRFTGDPDLDAALRIAEEEGIVAPQEVHQLMAQAMGRAALKAGDGTKMGDAAAKASNTLSKAMLAWGKVFSVAEQFNRRTTFIAAYRTAVEQNMPDPVGFAKSTIADTMFTYNKGAKPQWARGAIGGTLFTFKTYSINYVELLHRMATRGGAEGRKGALLAVGVLFLMSGMGGLPGSDDLDDLIDGLLQRLGYNFSSKAKKREFFAQTLGLGDGITQFIEKGISGLPGAPIDVSGRLGLGNLIPGTGLATKKADYGYDVAEFFGPAGDLATRAFKGAGAIATGDVGKGLTTMSPTAIQNAAKGYDMANTGMYRDQTGKKVIDVDGYDAAVKAIGFQPNDVARVQTASRQVASMVALNRIREKEISGQWAQAVFEKDPEGIAAARRQLAAWNAANPESPIRIDAAQVMGQVKSMNMTREQRLAKGAPREIRGEVARQLAQGAQ